MKKCPIIKKNKKKDIYSTFKLYKKGKIVKINFESCNLNFKT